MVECISIFLTATQQKTKKQLIPCRTLKEQKKGGICLKPRDLFISTRKENVRHENSRTFVESFSFCLIMILFNTIMPFEI